MGPDAVFSGVSAFLTNGATQQPSAPEQTIETEVTAEASADPTQSDLNKARF
jgi:hypothetical protein